MLLNEINELLVVYGTRANHDHVLTVVVASVEINDHVSVDLANVVNVAQNWLTHHVFAIDVVVHIFHQGLFGVLICCFEFLPNSIFFIF